MALRPLVEQRDTGVPMRKITGNHVYMELLDSKGRTPIDPMSPSRICFIQGFPMKKLENSHGFGSYFPIFFPKIHGVLNTEDV